MTQTREPRDFLKGQFTPPTGYDIGPSPAEIAGLSQAMQTQYDLLVDIRNLLMKQTPPVLTTTVIQNAGIGNLTITDNDQHEVFFEVGGKSVVVCKQKIWSTYVNTVYYSFNRMANPLDGIPFTTGNVLFDDSEVRSVYIWCPTFGGSNALNVNGNADDGEETQDGGFNIYAWTIPDQRGFNY